MLKQNQKETRMMYKYIKDILKWTLTGSLVIFVAVVSNAQAVSNDYGTLTLTPDGRGMKFKFEPSDSVDCDKIVFAQTFKIIFSNGEDLVMNPGDVWDGWRYKKKNALDDGTVLDGVATCEDPWVNGDDTDVRTAPETGGPKEDRGKQGKKNGSGKSDAEWTDYPRIGSGLFPEGKTKVRMEFEICVMCVEGEQSGTTYGCTTWIYEQDKGAVGSSRHTGDGDLDNPSGGFKEAMDKWEENHINEEGERYCPD